MPDQKPRRLWTQLLELFTLNPEPSPRRERRIKPEDYDTSPEAIRAALEGDLRAVLGDAARAWATVKSEADATIQSDPQLRARFNALRQRTPR